MSELYQSIESFLKDPVAEKDKFWGNKALVWIDWGEEEDAIIEYFNNHLDQEDQIKFELVNIDAERGIDIYLLKGKERTVIPYSEEKTDRDTTLKAVESYINPKYQIRWFMYSDGDDTLAFSLLLSEQWITLEKEFGEKIIRELFAPIKSSSVMFG